MSLTFDDYVAAGWKKSKQFDTSTVPEATDIWHGFWGLDPYDRKDIEVRFYDSHEIAKTYGFDNASEEIESLRSSLRAGNGAMSGVSVADELKKFAELRDQGIISDSEFDSKKTELLG